MLATDAHGGFGGISQYNRDVLAALSESDKVTEVVVIPRIIIEQDFDVPNAVRYVTAAAKGRLSYIACTISELLFGKQYDLVYCAHINLVPFATLFARLRRVPVLLAVYGIDVWKPPGRKVDRLASTTPDLVLSISEVTLSRFMKWTKGSSFKTAIVPNAVTLEDYGTGDKDPQLLQRYGLEGRSVIMTFGRMPDKDRGKGFDEVIASLPALRERIPNISYLAVGDGEDRQRLEAKAAELGVADTVIFTGKISDAEKADHYRLADAYVMPSSGEGFGFVVLEALACGLPVVASKIDGTFEAIRGGILGRAVNPSDQAELVSAIEAALKCPKKIQSELGYFRFDRFRDRIEQAVMRASGMIEP